MGYIEQALKSTKNNKAPGQDNIINELLEKKVVRLNRLYNYSITNVCATPKYR